MSPHPPTGWPAEDPATPLLELRGLRVAYGGIQAVKGLDLVVRRGELLTLIGANGAGKTSTLKALTGLVPAAAGTVRFDGRPLDGLGAWDRVRAGLVMVPEGRGIFARLSIDENLRLGAHLRRDAAGIAADLASVFARFPRLKERRLQLAGTLSGGEQQMLAMGRALMARPRLLLLDEPSMGLAPIMVDRIFELIAEIHDQGTTVLLVEQNASRALALADRGCVLESGELSLEGPAATLLADPRVQAAYLGA